MSNNIQWLAEPTVSRPVQRVIHVNTSASGGGVAEVLRNVVSELRQKRNAHHWPMDWCWAVMSADERFYAFTKLLHHYFHDRCDTKQPVDLLQQEDVANYRDTTAAGAEVLLDSVTVGDVVVLHDPQVLGMAEHLKRRGIHVVWQLHIGSRVDQRRARAEAWRWARNYLPWVDILLITDVEYVHGDDQHSYMLRQVAPAIDPTNDKNRRIPVVSSRAIWDGIFTNDVLSTRWESSALEIESRYVCQISRWDPLKGMIGTMQIVHDLPRDVHILLAGPHPGEVLDDPEGRDELCRAIYSWEQLPIQQRDRVHLLALKSTDRSANALAVNVLQSNAAVIVQNSLEEGFGLTVTEAMWKQRPVVATRVGGIPQQVLDGVNGRLVPAGSQIELTTAVNGILSDRRMALAFGAEAHLSVNKKYTIAHLANFYRELVEELTDS